MWNFPQGNDTAAGCKVCQKSPKGFSDRSGKDVPGRKNDGFLIVHFVLLLRQVLAVHAGEVDVFVEPCVAHDVVALVALLGAPAVLDLPLVGLAVHQIHAAQKHGVVGGGLAVIQHLALGHLDVEAEGGVVVIETGIPDALVPVAVGMAVTAEPQRVSGLELADHGGLELVHGQVQASHGADAVDALLPLDHIAAVKGLGGGGGIEDGYNILDIPGDVLVVEAPGGQIPVGVIDLVLVHILKVKGFGRIAQADGDDVVGSGEHVVLQGPDLGGCLACGHSLTENHGVLAQLHGQQHVHGGGVLALVGLRHGLLGADAVLLTQADEILPPAAVADAVAQQHGDIPVLQRIGGSLDDVLQEGVGLFQMVIEGNVALGQLKLLQIQILGHLFSQDVHGGENPAAAAGTLVAGAHGGHVHGELVVHLLCVGGVVADIVDGCLGGGPGNHLGEGVLLVAAAEFLQIFQGDGSIHVSLSPFLCRSTGQFNGAIITRRGRCVQWAELCTQNFFGIPEFYSRDRIWAAPTIPASLPREARTICG